jgi:hypothetical protein
MSYSLHALVRGQPVNNETIVDKSQSIIKPKVRRDLLASAGRFASRSEVDFYLLLKLRDKDLI